jgi:alpha-L-rhamnosidase
MDHKVIRLAVLLPLVLATIVSSAQDVYQNERKSWLEKAQVNQPQLIETKKVPQHLVTLIKDPAAFQGWTTGDAISIDSLYQVSGRKKPSVVVDFGEHITGYFTFTVLPRRSTPDAPVRFRLTFGEVPSELATPFDPYEGTLSRAWLQDEIVTLTELPATMRLPRRFSFRYLQIELLGSSRYFDFNISDMFCMATSSVTIIPDALASGTDAMIKAIDRTGLSTLKECMQTVYEDGPKRDRRLWIGDLYLESLANTYSFKNHNLTKRCLYLLAGLSREDGLLNSNVFETPAPHPQTGAPFLFDYSLIYNVALKEYLVATGDRETALDLWPLAKKQMDGPGRFITDKNIFDNKAAVQARWWLFIDWKDDLDRQVAIQGIIIYSMKQTLELARMLGKEKEVASLPAQIKALSAASRRDFMNKKTGLFESGDHKQVSYASQAWMILSDVASAEEGRKAMSALGGLSTVIHPGSPYLFHYYIEAMIHCGMKQEAKKALADYWGGMVNKKADTFWEVYDPGNEYLSPYNFFPVNSYCHAWSCTPVYFIRKYPDIFQK